jgi:hypothetical protein
VRGGASGMRSRDEDRSIIGYGGFWLMVDEPSLHVPCGRYGAGGLGELSSPAYRTGLSEMPPCTLEVRRTNTPARRST